MLMPLGSLAPLPRLLVPMAARIGASIGSSSANCQRTIASPSIIALPRSPDSSICCGNPGAHDVLDSMTPSAPLAKRITAQALSSTSSPACVRVAV